MLLSGRLVQVCPRPSGRDENLFHIASVATGKIQNFKNACWHRSETRRMAVAQPLGTKAVVPDFKDRTAASKACAIRSDAERFFEQVDFKTFHRGLRRVLFSEK